MIWPACSCACASSSDDSAGDPVTARAIDRACSMSLSPYSSKSDPTRRRCAAKPARAHQRRPHFLEIARPDHALQHSIAERLLAGPCNRLPGLAFEGTKLAAGFVELNARDRLPHRMRGNHMTSFVMGDDPLVEHF